jgi:hypothetical protein
LLFGDEQPFTYDLAKLGRSHFAYAAIDASLARSPAGRSVMIHIDVRSEKVAANPVSANSARGGRHDHTC